MLSKSFYYGKTTFILKNQLFYLLLLRDVLNAENIMFLECRFLFHATLGFAIILPLMWWGHRDIAWRRAFLKFHLEHDDK